MNEKIKSDIKSLIGKKVIAKVDIGRNKHEYFEGVVTEAYAYVFTIKKENEIKSFSYSDVLTKNIIIKLI